MICMHIFSIVFTHYILDLARIYTRRLTQFGIDFYNLKKHEKYLFDKKHHEMGLNVIV